MAGRIKGITVEIGGDTTGLDKSLKTVNSTIKSTQSALKDVNRLLKIDPKNTELLAQKQKLLQQEIKETSTKLDALKEADKQAKVQLENGDLGQDKYDALQREIIETEQSINRLQDELKKVPNAVALSVKEAGAKIKDIGHKTQDVGTKMSTHLTVPLVGIGAASIAAFNEVDAGLDTIVTKTGASGEALDEMQAIMERIATSIPTDFATAGAAIGEVNTRFGVTGEQLELLSSQFIKFAQINNVDVSTAIDNTQKVIAAFGLTTQDTGAVLDTMNAVGQRTGIGMDTLANTMVANASALQQLGFSASDAANFLGNVEMSGADTSQVMAGLTKALATATSEGKPLNEALSDIQNSMVNAKSDTEGLQAAYDLFGKRAGGAIYQACKNGSLNFNELGTSLKDNLGSVETTFENTIDPIDSFQTTMNQLKIVGADVGNILMTVLKPMLEKLATVFKNIKQGWDGLSPGMKEAITSFGVLVATVGPVVVVIGKIISAVGIITGALAPLIGLITGTGAATTAMGIAGAGSAAGTTAAGVAAGGAATGFGALNLSLLPIIGIIAGIVAAIAGIILVIKNWGAITEWFKGVWSTITETVSVVVQNLANFFMSAWNGMVSFFTTTWETIKSILEVGLLFLGSLMQAGLAIITLPFQFIWENCKEIILSAWESIKSTVGSAIEAVSEVISTVMGVVSYVISTIWQSISTTVSTVLTAIKSVVTTVFNSIKSIASNIWNGIKSVISSVVDGVKSKVSSVFNAVSSTLSTVFNSIKSTATSVWNNIKSAITSPIDAAKNTVKRAVDSIVGFFAGMKISFPKIKLPHFSIRGSFSLMPPSVPTLGIDWYKDGGIMTRPTLFGVNGSSLMAGGEAGHEAILPLKGFYNHLDKLFKERLGNNEVMEQYLAIIAENSTHAIYLDDGTLVGRLLPSIDSGLGHLAIRRERG